MWQIREIWLGCPSICIRRGCKYFLGEVWWVHQVPILWLREYLQGEAWWVHQGVFCDFVMKCAFCTCIWSIRVWIFLKRAQVGMHEKGKKYTSLYQPFSSQKTRLNDLLYGIEIWTDISSVFSQYTRLTNGRTDRRTDRILIARPRLHSMPSGKNARDIHTNHT